LRRDALSPTGEAQALRGGASHTHPVGLHAHRPRQPVSHLLPMRRDAWLLTDDHCVDVNRTGWQAARAEKIARAKAEKVLSEKSKVIKNPAERDF